VRQKNRPLYLKSHIFCLRL